MHLTHPDCVGRVPLCLKRRRKNVSVGYGHIERLDQEIIEIQLLKQALGVQQQIWQTLVLWSEPKLYCSYLLKII